MKTWMLLFALAVPGMAAAQQEKPTFPTAETVDLTDIESVVNAMLGVLSGAEGEKECDWDLWRTLHTPNSSSYMVVDRPDTSFVVNIGTEQFIERAASNYQDHHFWEYQVDIDINQFGRAATVYQNYEMRQNWDDGVLARGVNMHLMVFYDGRWWIAASTWDNEFLRERE